MIDATMDNGDKDKAKETSKKRDEDDDAPRNHEENVPKTETLILNLKYTDNSFIPSQEQGVFTTSKTADVEKRVGPDGRESFVSVDEEEKNPTNINKVPTKATEKLADKKLADKKLAIHLSKEKVLQATEKLADKKLADKKLAIHLSKEIVLQKLITSFRDLHGLRDTSTLSLDPRHIAEIKDAFREVLDERAHATSCDRHVHVPATTTDGTDPIPCTGEPRSTGGECRCCFIDCTCKCHSRNLKGHHESRGGRRAKKRKRQKNVDTSKQQGGAYPLKKNISDSGSDNTMIESDSEVITNGGATPSEFMAEMKWPKSSGSRRKAVKPSAKPHKDSSSSSSDESESDRRPKKAPLTNMKATPVTDGKAKVPLNDLSSENDRDVQQKRKAESNIKSHENKPLPRPDRLPMPFWTGASESSQKNNSTGKFRLGNVQSSNKKQLEGRHQADIQEPHEKKELPAFSIGEIELPNKDQQKSEASTQASAMKKDMTVSFSLDISEKQEESTETRAGGVNDEMVTEPGLRSVDSMIFEFGYQSDGQKHDECDIGSLDDDDMSVRAETQAAHDINATEDSQFLNVDTTKEYGNYLEVSNVNTRQVDAEGPKHTWTDLLVDCDGGINEKELTDMLQCGELPNQMEIQRTFEVYKEGHLSTNKFDSICNAICEHIQTKCDKLFYVRTYYTAQIPEQVVFVAMADSDVSINPDIVYDVKICHPQGYSKEGTTITSHDKRKAKPITPEESDQITATIRAHTDDLMRNHSNIHMISGCSVKSREFGTENPMIDLQTCIVIYVNVKGAIPMHEKALPRCLSVPGTDVSLPVDVREGGMRFFNKRLPNEYHQKLKMGCQINDGHGRGTLGPIIQLEIEEHAASRVPVYKKKTYFLTCAHVFFENPNQSFINLMHCRGVYSRADDTDDILVYQGSNQPFGIVQHAAFRSWDNDNEGVDVAVIEITDETRLPEEGSFPEGRMEDAGFDVNTPMLFKSGSVYDEAGFREQINNHNINVFKYGCETMYTVGQIYVENVVVKKINFPARHNAFATTLTNQLGVLSIHDGKPFADHGDSGALVFAKHDGRWDELRAVGIVEGGFSDDMVIVTPIWGIFKYLDRSTNHGLMKFNAPSLSRTDSGYGSQSGTLALRPPRALSETDVREQERSQELAGHFREANDKQQREMKELNSKLDIFKETTERMQKEQTDNIQNLQKDQAEMKEMIKMQKEQTDCIPNLQKDQAEIKDMVRMMMQMMQQKSTVQDKTD